MASAQLPPWLNPTTAFVGLGYAWAGILTTAGIRAIFDPIGQAREFGLPIDAFSSSEIRPRGDKNPASPTRRLVSWVRVAFARNIVYGLGIFYLLYSGQRRSASVLLALGGIVGVVDAASNYEAGNEAAAVAHGVGTVLLMGTGALGYRISSQP